MIGMTTDATFKVHAIEDPVMNTVKVFMYVRHHDHSVSMVTSIVDSTMTMETIPEGTSPEPTMIVSQMMWDSIREWFYPSTDEDGPLVEQLKKDLEYERGQKEWFLAQMMDAAPKLKWVVPEDEEPF